MRVQTLAPAGLGHGIVPCRVRMQSQIRIQRLFHWWFFGEYRELFPSTSGRCPCHLAGRSFRTSCPSLTRRKLRFAIPAPLSFQRRSIGMGNDPHLFDSVKKLH